MRYIALLRGINVGGHQVKMVHLREQFMELGFTHVRTYIQSGNVFFETANTEPSLQPHNEPDTAGKKFPGADQTPLATSPQSDACYLQGDTMPLSTTTI